MTKLNGVFAVVLALSVVTSVSAERRILVHASFASVKDKQRHPKPKRIRPIEPDFRALEAPSLHRNERRKLQRKLTAALFDDTVFHIDLEDVERNAIDAWVWTGKIEGHDNSSAVLVVKDRAMVGTIWTGTHKYMIEPVENGGHEVFELDLAAFPDEAEPISSELSNRIAGASTSMVTAADSGETIDILVAYTDDVRAALGSTAAAQAAASNAIAATNTAYAYSGVVPRVRLAATAQVSYAESGNLSTTLDHLRGSGDGNMDEVHALRDQLGADAVALLVDGGYGCGIAYIMDSYYVANPGVSFAPLAFSVTVQSCAVGNLSFPHELGHNFGLAHDRFVSPSALSPSYPYAFGYVDTYQQFRDIMAYGDACGFCPRILYFSTPNRSYLGRPLGVSYESSPSTSADNVRALNNNASLIANWRQWGISCHSMRAAANPAAGGSVNVSTAQNCSGGYTGVTAVAISASASSGYEFSGWTATNCTLANAAATTTTCTMTGDRSASVIAQFRPSGPELLVNGSFASGLTGWKRLGVFFADSRFSVCRSCPGYAYFSNADGTGGNDMKGWLYQDVMIPANATSATLTFWYNITTQETTTTTANDVMSVSIFDTTTRSSADIAELSNLHSTSSYVKHTADLSAYAGRTVSLNFNGSNDSSLPTIFRVDDASIQVTTATCTSFTISPSSRSASASSGSQTVTITGSPTRCQGGTWNASGNGSWLTVSPTSGSGPGSTVVSWDQNPLTSRSAGATIAGNVFSVTQDGTTPTCTSFTIDPSSWSPTSVAGSRTVTITGCPAGCQGGTWNASGNGSWLTVSPTSGSGSGSTVVSWGQNPLTSSRSANATIAGNPFSVTQGGADPRADFDGDLRSELLLRNTSNQLAMWDFTGRTVSQGANFATISSSSWRIEGFGDFDGDGRHDILYRAVGGTAVAMWLLNGPAIVSQPVVGNLPSAAWEFEAFGDFNGDGQTDALARNPATGQVAMWEFIGTTVVNSSVVYTVSDLNWRIQGTGDFNGDGDDEVIWRNTATEQMAMWEFSGRTLVYGAIFGTAPGTAWAVRAIGDFDADGRDDILWQNTSTLDVNVWDMNYRTIVANVFIVRVSSSFWRADAVGDYDGDGGDDIIWFNTSTRQVAMWELSSSHGLVNGGLVATVSGDYRIQPPFNPPR